MTPEGNIKTVISATFHPNINKWSGMCVQMCTPGTHSNYNVVYNSECNREYFETESEAKAAAAKNETTQTKEV